MHVAKWSCRLLKRLQRFFIFLFINKSKKKTETDLLCVIRAWYKLFFCLTELQFCPVTPTHSMFIRANTDAVVYFKSQCGCLSNR